MTRSAIQLVQFHRPPLVPYPFQNWMANSLAKNFHIFLVFEGNLVRSVPWAFTYQISTNWRWKWYALWFLFGGVESACVVFIRREEWWAVERCSRVEVVFVCQCLCCTQPRLVTLSRLKINFAFTKFPFTTVHTTLSNKFLEFFRRATCNNTTEMRVGGWYRRVKTIVVCQIMFK